MAEERSLVIQSLQDQLDELSGAQDSLHDARRGAEEENWSVVREELHRQADYLRALESTNAKMSMELNGLRERHASIEVLREEKRGLERKVKVLEELREKVVKLEAEVEAGRREREEWSVQVRFFYGFTLIPLQGEQVRRKHSVDAIQDSHRANPQPLGPPLNACTPSGRSRSDESVTPSTRS
jgi:hypothetical protein